MDWLSFRCSVLTLRFSSDFPELWESGLGRALTTAIPITDTDIIPTGITIGRILTMGITEVGHTTGLTGIERITTTIITIAIGGTKGNKGTRTSQFFRCLNRSLCAASKSKIKSDADLV